MATMDKTWQRCLVLVFFFVFWSEPDKGDDIFEIHKGQITINVLFTNFLDSLAVWKYAPMLVLIEQRIYFSFALFLFSATPTGLK